MGLCNLRLAWEGGWKTHPIEINNFIQKEEEEYETRHCWGCSSLSVRPTLDDIPIQHNMSDVGTTSYTDCFIFVQKLV